MTYEEVRALMRRHSDYSGSIDRDGLARALSGGCEGVALHDDYWRLVDKLREANQWKATYLRQLTELKEQLAVLSK